MSRVLGLDPSMSETGVADEEGGVVIKTKPDTPERLSVIHDGVMVFALDPRRADLALVEDLPQHAKSAGITGMAQGVIRLALERAGVPYVTVAPTTLKKFATGKGTATKPDMRMALYQRTGLDERNDNACDAIWLRYLGLALRDELPFELPAANLSALEKVQLP